MVNLWWNVRELRGWKNIFFFQSKLGIIIWDKMDYIFNESEIDLKIC